MTGETPVAEKLRTFVRDLPPATRGMLATELQKAIERGEPLPLSDLLLAELRPRDDAAASSPSTKGPAASVASSEATATPISPRDAAAEALWLFCEPFAGYLVDDAPDCIHPGRLSRAGFEAVWNWAIRDLAPAYYQSFLDTLAAAARDSEEARAAARIFQTAVLCGIDAMSAGLKSDERSRRRVSAQVGTPRAHEDIYQLALFLRERDTLTAVAPRIAAFRSFGDDKLDGLVSLLQAVHARQPQAFPSAIALTMAAAPAFWQPVRIAIRAAQSDSVQRIAETPFTIVVSIVMAELDRHVRCLAVDLKRGELPAAAARLKDIHDAVRGLRAELDLSSGAGWAREIAFRRSQIAECLKAEIESVPGRVRRLLRAGGGTAVLDAREVDDTERAITFLNVCRASAAELALNEMTTRVFSDLQQYLESTTDQLVESLRNAGPTLAARASKVDAAVKFCAKVFGQDYAQLLVRAADIAKQDERRLERA